MVNSRKHPAAIVTLDTFLRDPLIRAVMKADRVDEAEVRSLFHAIRGRRAPSDAERKAAEAAAIRYGLDAHYRPGVGIMLFDPRGHVFVGRRIGNARRAWQMPQGGIDDGEDARDAAIRELREEIGTDRAEFLAESQRWLRYDVPPAAAEAAWGRHWRGQQQKWFAMRFRGRDAEIDLATAHPEFSDWRWAPGSSVPNLIVGFKHQLYLAVLREFGHLAGSDGAAPDAAGPTC